MGRSKPALLPPWPAPAGVPAHRTAWPSRRARPSPHPAVSPSPPVPPPRTTAERCAPAHRRARGAAGGLVSQTPPAGAPARCCPPSPIGGPTAAPRPVAASVLGSPPAVHLSPAPTLRDPSSAEPPSEASTLRPSPGPSPGRAAAAPAPAPAPGGPCTPSRSRAREAHSPSDGAQTPPPRWPAVPPAHGCSPGAPSPAPRTHSQCPCPQVVWFAGGRQTAPCSPLQQQRRPRPRASREPPQRLRAQPLCRAHPPCCPEF
mmetsp:Transcript_17408/g.33254  ORF Transcript_17408/g.33254 Transcript_17408/m.33254 type:complete len:259 (-) Transcript_17408:2932-3708(-)